jgi:Na+-driven multidrug efflux pump
MKADREENKILDSARAPQETSVILHSTTGYNAITQTATQDSSINSAYREVWPYSKIFLEFNGQAIPFSLVRMVDTLGEVVTGYLFSISGGAKYLAANNLIIVSNRFLVAPATASFFSIANLYIDCRDDSREVGTLIRKGFAGAGLLSIVITPILLSSGRIFELFGINHEVSDIVEDYYIGAVLNIPLTIFSAVIQQFTLAIGKQKETLLINAINNLLSVGFGAAFMKNFGARGLGYGSSLASALTGLSYFLYFKYRDGYAPYQLMRDGISDLKNFLDVIYEASPFSLQMAADFLLLYLGALMAGWLSTDALSASRIIEMIYILPYIIITRYPQVTCKMGSLAKAQNNSQLFDRIYNVNIISMLTLTSAWSLTAYLTRENLINIFIDVNEQKNQIIVSIAKDLFWIYPLSLAPEIFRYTAAGALRACKDYSISMKNSLIWLAGVGSGSLYLGYHFGSTLDWIYGAKAIALTAGAGSLLYQYAKKKNEVFLSRQLSEITVIEHEQESVVQPQTRPQTTASFLSKFSSLFSDRNKDRYVPVTSGEEVAPVRKSICSKFTSCSVM